MLEKCGATQFASEGVRHMATLTLHIPDDKYQRLCALAQKRGTTVNCMVDEMTTLMLAEFDAETRFQLRATHRADKISCGLELLDKATETGTGDCPV